MTQIRAEMIESSSMKGKGRGGVGEGWEWGKRPSVMVTVIQGFSIWQCTFVYTNRNPQENTAHRIHRKNLVILFKVV